jgi:hypothetical protein
MNWSCFIYGDGKLKDGRMWEVAVASVSVLFEHLFRMTERNQKKLDREQPILQSRSKLDAYWMEANADVADPTSSDTRDGSSPFCRDIQYVMESRTDFHVQ